MKMIDLLRLPKTIKYGLLKTAILFLQKEEVRSYLQIRTLGFVLLRILVHVYLNFVPALRKGGAIITRVPKSDFCHIML